MDKYERRRTRLKQLLNVTFVGKIADLATAIDKPASLVSRYLYPPSKDNSKQMGEKMREDIEEALKLPRGWLDMSEDKSPPLPKQETLYPVDPNLIRKITALPAKHQRKLLDMADMMAKAAESETSQTIAIDKTG